MNRTSSAPIISAPRHYSGLKGHWDELLQPSGFPRRHWRRLSVAIGRMSFQELNNCWNAGQQLIQANGISYNVGSDPQDQERPWPMDPIPMLISEAEWKRIEAAVSQRASLLNAILGDLYGEQRLVREGRLPPELLFANPHFLRPCHGVVPRDGAHLQSYAADLARSADGSWRIVSDRTQAPAGAGYALENRLVSARTLPNIFNQNRVQPLTPFFDRKRAALQALAESQSASARVVLLTAGPNCEAYFEHSFLAGHWGFPLVEGADLTVRDDRVYLKTLAGLEPVDLIVRWLGDSYCDPLELRSDSLLGVPGLLQAVRSGNVVIDNALGAELIETCGHMAFLPGLCRQFFDQELLMPSVATFWCGDPEARRYALEHLDEVVVLPAFSRFGAYSEFPASMSTSQRQDLARKIEEQPEQFVAQEILVPSTAPVYDEREQRLIPGELLLRVFAAWDGECYQVMPGGLTRIFTDTPHVSSMLPSTGSKDAWVLCEQCGEEPLSRLVEVSSGSAPASVNLPSRVAENLFWLGRYAERVESNVRLVRALLPALSGEDDHRETVSLKTAVQLLVGLDYLPAEVSSASLHDQLWRVQRLLSEVIYDRTRTFGLGWNLRELRRVAWNLKERLSPDTWRVLQRIENDFSQNAPDRRGERYSAQMNLLDGSIVTFSAFSGLLMENTTRGLGWHFLEIGRRLERALQMTHLLRAGIAEPPADNLESHLQLLLRIADSSITYRSRHLTLLRLDLLLHLLLVDSSNPRSVGFQLAALVKHLKKVLPNEEDILMPERQRIKNVRLLVRQAQMPQLCRRDEDGRLGELEAFLEEIGSEMYALSDALTGQYLSHSRTALLRSSG